MECENCGNELYSWEEICPMCGCEDFKYPPPEHDDYSEDSFP